MNTPVMGRQVGLPLAMQMIAILICALVAAQLVTLALTVILPPKPPVRWDLGDVAAALGKGAVPDRLERRTMAGPPDVSGQGWLVSDSSRDALARKLGLRPDAVVLAFYTQLPVGGVAVPAGGRSPLAAVPAPGGIGPLSLIVDTAQAQSIPGGPPAGGAPTPGGMPGGGFPGGMPPGGIRAGGQGPRAPSFPGGSGPGSAIKVRPMPGGTVPRGPVPRGPVPGGAVPGGAVPGGSAPNGAMPGGALQGAGNPGAAPVGGPGQQSVPAGAIEPGGQNHAIPAPIGGDIGAGPVPGANGPGAPGARDIVSSAGLGPSPMTRFPAQPLRPASTGPAVSAIRAPAAVPSAPARSDQTVIAAPAPASIVAKAAASASTRLSGAGIATTPEAGQPQPIPFRRTQVGLFDGASTPFIEGDFVAAARQSDGTWLAVAPRAEPFPNAWQQRVMLWFALSLAIVSPLVWLFARRIVVPLGNFAKAAEQLGRDPSATILPLSGPAEIGRAANAFNQMRNRLRAFVDDRTAMVGAISHDLRTPLTRLRFRIENVPDDQREGLLKEVSEMEAMISQVIAFIRDASTPGPRERVDFADLVAGSVADARLVGVDVEIERNVHIPVDVDPVGIRRLLGNLLENAAKYGENAKVRVSLSGGEAVAEIVDTGPGIPAEEFDRAFEPFYRSETARKSGQEGSGLGLAVCRSIARAHGGDVCFERAADGFVARVRVPAAYAPAARKAA